MTSRVDAVQPKTIENGVIVAPGLQVNEMTLRERQDYNTWILLQRRLDRNEAESLGYRESEIDAYFGQVATGAIAKGEGVASPVIPSLPIRDAFNRVAPTIIAAAKETSGFDRVKARTMGFTGDVCVGCGSTRMTRNGSCILCQECGQTTGCS